MDQIKIGKFIANERKKKGYTQMTLSEKLGISNKTVSKWECGKGFPEVSLLLPLCKELDITVNELLSGERFSSENYIKKAEENFMDIRKEKKNNKRKRLFVCIAGWACMLSYISLVLICGMYRNVIDFPMKIIIIVVGLIEFTIGFILLWEGLRRIGYYRCSKCGEYFVPKFKSFGNIFRLNMFRYRYLKCPCCNKKNWCKKSMSKEEKDL